MEFLDIRTSDGKITGRKKLRSQIHIDGDIHGAVHTWIIRHKENGKIDVLLQKRAAQNNKDVYAGGYDISCAGHVDSGEEYRDAAIRELREELGINILHDKLKFIGLNDGYMQTIFQEKPFRNHEICAVYIYDEKIDEKTIELQKEEVESVVWIDITECRHKLWTGEIKNSIFNIEFKMIEKFFEKSNDDNIV